LTFLFMQVGYIDSTKTYAEVVMDKRFTNAAENVLTATLEAAKECKQGYIGTEHLLLGLLSQPKSAAGRVLAGKGVDREKICDLLQSREIMEEKEVEATDMTPRLRRIIERCAQVASHFGSAAIGSEHILYAMLEESECVAVKLLISCGLYMSDLLEELTPYFTSDEEEDKSKSSHQNRERDFGGKSHTLEKFATDLTAAAELGRIDPIIGRDEETSRVIQIILRRTKNNPCLIGEPGVGKTAVVEGLARRIAEKNVPLILRDKRVYRLDLSSMIAGAKYRGEFEERMKSVVEEVQKRTNVILFIDELHTIVGAGAAEGAVDAANILKPALARGELQVIGATTFREYRKYIEKDAALERRFQAVTVGEPSRDEAVQILTGLRERFEKHHRLKISDEAISAAVDLSIKYIPERYLPDKSIDLIDEAASKKRIEGFVLPKGIETLEREMETVTREKEEAIKQQSYERAAQLRDRQLQLRTELINSRTAWERECSANMLTVGEEEIEEIVTAWTGVPAGHLAENEAQRYLHVEDSLRQRVIGQETAVKTVANVIRRAGAGIHDPGRPMGSFLFVGPTGVGKTELAKAVAVTMFGSESAMIRVDMSEYAEKQSISRLIGAAPGYVGYDEGGQLTERVRRMPYSLVLFDEIEKAHPDLYNTLLQILDEGRLTDSAGRCVDFKNTVIIMTSNVGSRALVSNRKLGFEANEKQENVKGEIEKELKNTFPAEFLNRIDETVYFEQLSFEEVKRIAKLQLEQFRARLLSKGIKIDLDDTVSAFLAEHGYDPQYGARPLHRVIRRMVEDPVSLAILRGQLRPIDSAICTVDKDQIVIKRQH